MDSELQNSEVKILFFAKARELTEYTESQILLPAKISYQALLETIVLKFGLQSIRDIIILSINEEYVAADAILNLADRDEIAVIPPLSGG
ncbi:molybdopterin synthase sulfur carrier subunit-like isoform X6 [Athalia rosae]|uniref:molybdopterin synthase sulfur carrier subunit-like isoform X6 n=1 Tax=Athalia rosae TaxID=37344 RepID=UPI0006255BB0|nr:molybdopterin synthase sulfur carrier subunit-like isoform X6 [Athalia rosae]